MSTYDLESVQLPVLHGAPLKAFAGVLKSRLLRPVVLPKLLADAGIPRLHAQAVQETPTFLPLVRVEGGGTPAPDFREVGDAVLGGERDNPWPSARDYARAYREGGTTPKEVAERALAAMAESNAGDKPLRAMVAVDEAEVRRMAAESATRLKEGKARSVLEGVPVVVKDELDMTPFPTTVGTSFLGREAAAEDATVVARLRAAGALLLGKANMHEIGINPNGHNLHLGMARNPWNRSHDTGGSSSGSAGAVAAGLAPIAIGADGGGSIRIPAALCGVVGLKATFGRISEHGAAPLCWSVAHVGPICATVEDLVLAYAATAGADPADAGTLAGPPPSIEGWDRGDLDGVRLGVFRPWNDHAETDVVGACNALVDKLAGAGAEVRQIEVPDLDLVRVAHAVTILTEMATAMGDHADHLGDHAASVRISLLIGRSFTARDYVQAQRVRTRALRAWAGLFDEVDAIITPATASTAPAIREQAISSGWNDLGATTEIMRYAFPSNLLGHPAISFPAGYDGAGLPVGMQAIGRHWDEALLLRIASVAEGIVARRTPETFFNLLPDGGTP